MKIAALESDILRVEQESDDFAAQYDRAEERAKEAEAESRALAYQFRQLRLRITSRPEIEPTQLTPPSSWDQLPQWCEKNFLGLLVLTPTAKRGIKKAEFDDVELVARSLVWLVQHARPIFLGDGNISLRDLPIESGVINTPCGGDAFEFDWNGRRLNANWHIKNGGNTREPRRCLRIYYTLDDETQQIIVANMPAHIETSAT